MPTKSIIKAIKYQVTGLGVAAGYYTVYDLNLPVAKQSCKAKTLTLRELPEMETFFFF